MEENNAEPKTIHTYQTDVEDALKRDNVSKSKIFVAEQERREERQIAAAPKTSGFSFNFRSIVFAILFLIAGGMAAYFFIIRSHQPAVPQKVETTPEQSIISYESFVPINLQNSDRLPLTSAIAEQKQKYSSTGIEIVSFGLTSEHFLNIIAPNMSGTFVRSLDPSFAFGFVSKDTATEPTRSFLVLKTDEYSTSRGSLLSEEPFLQQEIGDIFDIPDTEGLTFKDKVIDNHDARVLVDDQNNEYFLYSFLDSSTLVFAEDDDTFKIITDGINAAKR